MRICKEPKASFRSLKKAEEEKLLFLIIPVRGNADPIVLIAGRNMYSILI
jgi:hypothetical protein